MTAPLEIAVALVIQNCEILVGIRQAHQTLAGKREFPGGKVEDAETITQALIRETYEETGLVIEPVQEYLTQTHTYDHGTVRLNFWRCQLSPTQTHLLQMPFVWQPVCELKTEQFPSGNRSVIDKLIAEYCESIN